MLYYFVLYSFLHLCGFISKFSIQLYIKGKNIANLLLCQKLTAFIEKLMTLFQTKGKAKTFAKGEFLIKEGEVEKNLYLIEEGAVRAILLSDLEEHTIRLGYEGSFINSLSSFIKQSPSEFYIEAIRKTTVKIIAKEALQNLINTSSTTQDEYIALVELLVTQQIEREIDILTASPLND